MTFSTASTACSVTGNTVHIVSVGSCTVTASQAGDNNYNAAPDVSQSFNIDPATVTVTATGVDKTYDGNNTATVKLLVSGAVNGDSLTATDAAATFDGVDVGPHSIAVTGIALVGTNANDYTSNTDATANANITQATLTVTPTDTTKTYGDTTTFAGTEFTETGLISPDTITSVTLASDGAVSTAPVSGSPYTIVASAAVGSGLNNYTIDYSHTGKLTVTPKLLTGSVTVGDKTYDGTTNATVTGCSLTGVINSDAVTCSATSATFSDKNVDTGKKVTATGLSLSNTNAGNYTVNPTATATASINPLAITVTAVSDTKGYDGNTSSVGVPTIAPALATGDSPSFTQTFDSPNVGTEKTLTPAGSVDDNNGGNNYTVTFANNTTGVITAKI